MWVWVVPVRGVDGMDAVDKPTGRYSRRPLAGISQTYRSESRLRVTTFTAIAATRAAHRHPPEVVLHLHMLHLRMCSVGGFN